MYFMIIGVKDGVETTLARGVNTLGVGEHLLKHCLDYDSFIVRLDSSF